MKVAPPDININGGSGTRRSSNDKSGEGDSSTKSELMLPNIKEVYGDKWIEHGFDKYSAIDVVEAEGQMDLYINMENIFLLSEIKNKTGINADVLKNQFKYSLALFSISYISLNGNTELPDITAPSKAFSMIILPMLNALNNLDEAI